VAAAERAVSAEGHVIVDMADFPAADLPAAQLCADRVRGCDVYVGILGTQYGSPVRDKPTELEFDSATEAGLDRLVFLLDTGVDDVRIPRRHPPRSRLYRSSLSRGGSRYRFCRGDPSAGSQVGSHQRPT
jgi:hypothetical protein